jgi:hypothetical protein
MHHAVPLRRIPVGPFSNEGTTRSKEKRTGVTEWTHRREGTKTRKRSGTSGTLKKNENRRGMRSEQYVLNSLKERL